MPIENTFERDFQDSDSAEKLLGILGYSLEGPFCGKYLVFPMNPPADYPRRINSKKPRPLATVTLNGNLVINEFPDQNAVLIRCQEELREKVEGLTARVKK